MATEPTAPVEQHDVDVVIAGGGPGGLSLALQLGRFGLRVALFDNKPGYTTFAKGQFVHSPTAERWRSWGVLEQVESAHQSEAFQKKVVLDGVAVWGDLASGPLALYESPRGRGPVAHEQLRGASPEEPHRSVAFVYEPILDRVANSFEGVTTKYARTVVGFEQDDDGVLVTVQPAAEGALEYTVRGKYFIGADGGDSTVRRLLDIDQITGGVVDDPQTAIGFYGDLEKYKVDHFMNHILGPRNRSYLVNVPVNPFDPTRDPSRTLWVLITRNPGSATVSEAEARERVQAVVGDDEFEFEIESVRPLRQYSKLSATWRVGRVFLLGDANHRHTPWGGFGQNLASAESENLAWKLASVVSGQAGDALLDTYETERLNQAITVIRWTTFYDAFYSSLETAFHEFRELDPDAVSSHRFFPAFNHFHDLPNYFHFGGQYESSAVLSDGSEVEVGRDITEYRRTGVPGARAPHIWLRSENERTSTRYLVGSSWLLFADDHDGAWSTAAGEWTGKDVCDVVVHSIGEGQQWEPEEDFHSIVGVGQGGAILVRPDGHIGARFASAPTNHADALIGAIRRLLSVAEVRVPRPS